MQVCYSAGWAATTLSDFREALASLFRQKSTKTHSGTHTLHLMAFSYLEFFFLSVMHACIYSPLIHFFNIETPVSDARRLSNKRLLHLNIYTCPEFLALLAKHSVVAYSWPLFEGANVQQHCPCSAALFRWLSAWHTSEMSLDRARTVWLSRQNGSMQHACGVLRDVDLIALCQYAMTGDVPTANSDKTNPLQPSTGSIVMFTELATKLSDHALDENFLQTLPADSLAREWLQAVDVVAAGASLMRRRVQALAKAVQDHTLSIQVFSWA